MNNKRISFTILISSFCATLVAQSVNVSIDVNAERQIISPLIYGKNNSLSDAPSSPLSATDWQLLNDAGITFFRESGGNNSTKYNWRRKITSHPDWYNNVYSHNWDYAAQSLQANLPAAYGMWSFQLIGKAASNKDNNFNDWAYNSSQWWSGTSQNLAGGGTVNTTGGADALVDGNPDLYLMNWPADSTVAILDQWFNSSELNLNADKLIYWSMDNEPEIWSGTHDDIMPNQLAAEEFMQKYFDVAKKARVAFPEIKLVGPVPANEWQWYIWNNELINDNGTYYTWLEFFIKRIAEEQASTGTRLLDVLDIHFYPVESNIDQIVQIHRVFFDKTYDYPGANGIKKINGGWDNSQTKEYIFERCNDWLLQHLGANHGVSLSVSEMDINSNDADVNANWYASMLGTFAKHGVEFFTPWSWKKGMYETVHLFSAYYKSISVKTTSDNEQLLSAFASTNETSDSVTIVFVNHSQSQTVQASTLVSNFTLQDGSYNSYTLSNLPSNETFVSKSQNALVSSLSSASGGVLSVSIPALSVKAVILTGNPLGMNDISLKGKDKLLSIKYLADGNIKCEYQLNQNSKLQIKLVDLSGKEIESVVNQNLGEGLYSYTIKRNQLTSGIYIISVLENHILVASKKIKL